MIDHFRSISYHDSIVKSTHKIVIFNQREGVIEVLLPEDHGILEFIFDKFLYAAKTLANQVILHRDSVQTHYLVLCFHSIQ